MKYSTILFLAETGGGGRGGPVIEDFGNMIAETVEFMKVPFTLYGYTFSLWQVYLFSIVAGLLLFLFIHYVLGD